VSETTFRRSLDDLRAAQKPPRGVSVYSTHVNRPAGRLLAASADVLGLRPNQVTALSGLFSLAAVLLLVLVEPSAGTGLAVGAALVVGFMLDSADGQLARLHRSGSRAGEWFDHVLDCAVKLLLHAGVLVAWYRFRPDDDARLLLPLAFQVVAVLMFFAGVLVEQLRPAGQPRPAAPPGRLRSLLLLPVDNGVLCCTFLLWGAPRVFEVVYAVLFVAHLLYLGAFFRAWYRELSA
jgi:phosphatidylglycerophosphate synthase